MNQAQQIVHESETQRQFIRLQLPAVAVIDGERFTVKDLSSGGMALHDMPKSMKNREVLNLTLVLPFCRFFSRY